MKFRKKKKKKVLTAKAKNPDSTPAFKATLKCLP